METEVKKAQGSDKNKDEGKSKGGKLAIAAGVSGIVLVLFVIWGVWLAMHPAPEPLQGQIDATTVDVAAKIPGRLETVDVKEGDRVEKGSLVATLSIPEIEAKMRQAQAVERAREAQASLAQEGARPQEREAARAMYERAAAAEDLAQKTFDRVERLFKEGFVPAQRLDEASANLRAAQKAALAAKQQWSIAETGARRQEKEAARAMASQAQGAVAEVQSYAVESEIRSPIAGEVSRVLLRAGEVAPQGFAVATVVDLEDQWAVFNLREDELQKIRVGTVLKVKVPAVGGAPRDFKVYFINPKADYATWRATRQNSGYDLRTFEVRARPVQAIEGLRPGMTALIER